jgi:hypothetical protein
MDSSDRVALSLSLLFCVGVYALFYVKVNYANALDDNMAIFWAEMKWNLLTSLIDFVFVVLGVGFLVGYLDDRKWRSARKLVAQNGADAAAWCTHAGHHCFATEGVSPEHQSLQMRHIFLQKFQNQIQKFEESIHLCNSGLGKDLMPVATEAVWCMKSIIPIYAYLLSTLTAEVEGQGHVFAVPADLINQIAGHRDKMAKTFGLKVAPWFVIDPQRSVNTMRDFVKRNPLVYHEGSVPEYVSFEILNLYDTNMLRSLNGAKNIKAVRLFSDL